MAAQLIPIQVWAEQVFGTEAPHRNTLKRWVMLGKLLPAPTRVGRRYFVAPDARYIDPEAEKIQRLVNGR